MKFNYQSLWQNQKYQFLAVILILFLFLTLCITSLFLPLKESITYDEPYHYNSAHAILQGKAGFRSDLNESFRNIMPISALNLLASQFLQNYLPIEQFIPEDNPFLGEIEPFIFFGKAATILAGVVLGIYVFIWSKKLYGIAPAFLALIVYVLDPNILAHSRLFTQDVFGACAVFIATYYFWSLLRFGGRKNLILSALTFGIAQICRFTSVHLVPIFIILSLGFYSSSTFKAFKNRNISLILQGIKQAVYYATVFVLAAILIINIGFSFERTFTKFGDYKFISHSFNKLQENEFLNQIPVPIPYAYLPGLDFGKYKQETGFDSGIPYLLERLSFDNDPIEGFRIKAANEYFLVAFLYKVPLATQILFFLAILSLFINRKHIVFWKNEAFLVIPSLFYFVFMSFNTAQLGIRYILMIFPFLFVFSSRVVMGWNARKLRYRLFIISLVFYLLISNLSYFPHYISYFNELVIDRKMSYKFLADSNLDWGQNRNYLDKYLQNNPNAIFMRYDHKNQLKLYIDNQEVNPEQVSLENPINLLVVEANQLVGVTTDSNRFYWLRSSREPIDHLAYSYLIFKIDAKDAPDIFKNP